MPPPPLATSSIALIIFPNRSEAPHHIVEIPRIHIEGFAAVASLSCGQKLKGEAGIVLSCSCICCRLHVQFVLGTLHLIGAITSHEGNDCGRQKAGGLTGTNSVGIFASLSPLDGSRLLSILDWPCCRPMLCPPSTQSNPGCTSSTNHPRTEPPAVA